PWSLCRAGLLARSPRRGATDQDTVELLKWAETYWNRQTSSSFAATCSKLSIWQNLFCTNCFIPHFDLGLVVQNHVQQGIMDFQFSVVFDKTQFAEFVHEKAYACSSRADHLRCARAGSGHAVAAAPMSVMNSRRLNRSDCIRSPPGRSGLQDIELARIGQRVKERFYNLRQIR